MKNNKNIKILLPLVVLLWGILIYKIVAAMYPPSVNTTTMTKSTFVAPKTEQKQTFSLLPTDRDPFLGTLNAKEPVVSKKRTPRPDSDIPWPQLEYFGLVSDEKTRASVYIVAINGQQYLLQKGEEMEGVKVVKGFSETISIRFNEQTREFSIM